MISLEDRVRATLRADGECDRPPNAIRPRKGQLAMALAVARAIEQDERLVVEAGTGLGKTYAYLVPLLLSERRVLISTASQALQEQLIARDIPAVSRSLGKPVRVAMLKGRSNYVCVHRLEQVVAGGPASMRDPALASGLQQVRAWAQASVSGDLSELAQLDERSPLRPLITSTRENCLGDACPSLASCHVNRARQTAQAADWVVINHHVLLADHLLREAGSGGLLPSTDVVVLDEAHRIKDLATEQLGQSISAAMLGEFARDLAAQGPQWARGMRPWGHLALTVDRAIGDIGKLSHEVRGGATRSRWQMRAPEGVDTAAWLPAAAGLAQALNQATLALQATAGAAMELQRLFTRAADLRRVWSSWTHPTIHDPEQTDVRWMNWGLDRAGIAQWQMCQTPVHPSAVLRRLFGHAPGVARCWVLTSATLGSGESLTWFTRGVGLEGMEGLRTLRLPSPFDHSIQAALYVPPDLPEPGQDAHAVALADAVGRWARRLGGRALVLATSLRGVQRIAARLNEQMLACGDGALEVLVQGRMSRPALLERFRRAGARSRGAVLVASASFWEGVDLPGDTLQLLVIDKLPFPVPGDPLLEAQARHAEALGERPFESIFLPEAAQALKQGVGRLIRSETDRGVVVIADRRLLTRSYGQTLLAALPPMKQLMDEAQLLRLLDELVSTRASTKDHPSA